MTKAINWKSVDGYHAAAAWVAEEPGCAEAWLTYGRTREFRNEAEESLRAYRCAAALAPKDMGIRLTLADSLSNLNPYNRTERRELDPYAAAAEAEGFYESLLATPDSVGPALIGIARVKMRVGKFSDAFSRLEQAVRQHRECMGMAWDVMAGVPAGFAEKDDLRLLILRRDPAPDLKARVLLSVAQVEMAEGEIARERERLHQALDLLGREKIRFPLDAGRMFQLYRQDALEQYKFDSIPLRKRLTAFFGNACPELDYVSPWLNERLDRPAPKRLRLGCVLHRCRDVDFASALADMFAGIDRTRFETILFYNDKTLSENVWSRRLWELVDEKIVFPIGNWRDYCDIVARAKVDVLLHENCAGVMSFTGFAKLAPVQCNFHDMSFSFATNRDDYLVVWNKSLFLSKETAKTSEKEAVLSASPLLPNPERARPAAVSRGELGIPGDAKLLLSWQNLMRWLPKDDEVIGTLLQRNPDTWFLARHDLRWDTKFIEERWRRGALAKVMDRVRFFHYLPLERLLGAIKLAEAILPAPLDGGLVSIATALAMDAPLVVCNYGRFAALDWYYEIMGVDGLTARNSGEYIAIVDRLLNDPEWRAAKSREIGEKKHRMFTVKPYVDELQDFLAGAYERARRGLPPAGWRRGCFEE